MPSATLAGRLTFGVGTLGMAFLATAVLTGPATPASSHQRPGARDTQLTKLTTDRQQAAASTARRLTALGPETPLAPVTDPAGTRRRPAARRHHGAQRHPDTRRHPDARRNYGAQRHHGARRAAAGPRVSAVVPAEGAPGWPVSLTGRRFRNVTSVSFGGVSASFTVTSATRIVTTIPARAQSGRITVITSAGHGQGPTFSVTPVQTLEPGETLPSADALLSQDGHYTLAMQGNGDLVYAASGTSHRLWSSGTGGRPGAYLTMLSNGNLVIYAASGATTLWSSKTAGHGPARLVAQTNGSLVTYDGSSPTWTTSSYDATLRPGERLQPGWFLSSANGDKLTMAKTGNLIETGPKGTMWSTSTSGHDGAVLIMRADGNLALRGHRKTLWSSRTAGHAGARLVLQPTGVLAVRYQGHALWASHKAPKAPPARLTLGRWTAKAGPRAAHAYYGYPYPDPPACTDHGACVADKWAFYRGQCTSWVAYRVNELNGNGLNGIAFTNSYGGKGTWGDAVNWGAQARKLKITVNGTPVVGSIAWYGATKAAPDGHVAYVEKVNSPTSVVMSEMNYDADNGFWVHTITRATGDWPTGFIHLADR
jgi:surface antigen